MINNSVVKDFILKIYMTDSRVYRTVSNLNYV